MEFIKIIKKVVSRMKRMTKAEMLEFGRKFYKMPVETWTDEAVVAYVKAVINTKRAIDRGIERRLAKA